MSHLTAWCHQPHDRRLASFSLHQPRQAHRWDLKFGISRVCAINHAFPSCPQIHPPIIFLLPWQTHNPDCCRELLHSKTGTELLFAFSEELTNYYTHEMTPPHSLPPQPSPPPFVILRHILVGSFSNCINISFRIHEQAIKVTDEKPDRCITAISCENTHFCFSVGSFMGFSDCKPFPNVWIIICLIVVAHQHSSAVMIVSSHM